MDEDIKVLKDFFDCDDQIRGSLMNDFYSSGSMVFEESTRQVLSFIAKRLHLSEREVDEIVYDKKKIVEKMVNIYMDGASEFCSEFGRTKKDPDEITHGTYTVDDETYGNAQIYCRLMRGKIYELDDPSASKSISDSPFSRIAMKDVDYLRDYIGNNFGREPLRNFERYCENEVYEHLANSVSQANHYVSKKAMGGIDQMQASTRPMNKDTQASTTPRVMDLL